MKHQAERSTLTDQKHQVLHARVSFTPKRDRAHTWERVGDSMHTARCAVCGACVWLELGLHDGIPSAVWRRTGPAKCSDSWRSKTKRAALSEKPRGRTVAEVFR